MVKPNRLGYNGTVDAFRDRLLRTVRDVTRALGDDGVIVGSEVPNLHLLAARPAGRGLFVSQDLDTAFRLPGTGQAIRRLRGWRALPGEPSVLAPADPGRRLELNLLAIDPGLSLGEAEVDARLGAAAFGTMNLIRRTFISLAGRRVPVATLASLAVEKLATARTGIKGGRDLHVARMAVALMRAPDLVDVKAALRGLPPELAHHAAGNVAILLAQDEIGGTRTSRRERAGLEILAEAFELEPLS